jgi:hypothetical protein
MRVYRSALSIFEDQGWKYISDHVHFHLGRQWDNCLPFFSPILSLGAIHVHLVPLNLIPCSNLCFWLLGSLKHNRWNCRTWHLLYFMQALPFSGKLWSRYTSLHEVDLLQSSVTNKSIKFLEGISVCCPGKLYCSYLRQSQATKGIAELILGQSP